MFNLYVCKFEGCPKSASKYTMTIIKKKKKKKGKIIIEP